MFYEFCSAQQSASKSCKMLFVALEAEEAHFLAAIAALVSQWPLEFHIVSPSVTPSVSPSVGPSVRRHSIGLKVLKSSPTGSGQAGHRIEHKWQTIRRIGQTIEQIGREGQTQGRITIPAIQKYYNFLVWAFVPIFNLTPIQHQLLEFNHKGTFKYYAILFEDLQPPSAPL